MQEMQEIPGNRDNDANRGVGGIGENRESCNPKLQARPLDIASRCGDDPSQTPAAPTLPGTTSMTTRRDFLKTAAAVPILAPATAAALARQPKVAANERITMATIGTGGQGSGDMGGLMSFPQVQMVAVCDVVPEHRE